MSRRAQRPLWIALCAIAVPACAFSHDAGVLTAEDVLPRSDVAVDRIGPDVPASDGCVLGTRANCSACGDDCAALANVDPGSAACTAGTCTIGGCAIGFANCDGVVGNGCEGTLGTPGHCASCSSVCSGATPVCLTSGAAPQCVAQCMSGTTLCGSSCIDLNASVANCGACANACPGTTNGHATCVAGSCGIACDAGFVPNGGACTTNCGNRTIDSGESCDDGGRVGGDGCSATCTVEPGVFGSVCPAAGLITIGAPGHYEYRGTTTGAPNTVTGGTACSMAGPDRSFTVSFNISGGFTYTATATPLTSWDLVISAGTDCSVPYCADSHPAGGAETSMYAFTGAVTVAFVIDGYHSNSFGPFSLTIDVM